MSARISLARPASGGYTPDPHGFSNSRPSAGYRAANPDDPLEKLRAFARQVEDNVEIYTQPLKPHLPAIGRFLIVVTFLEDSLRIITQWGDQLWYLQRCAFMWQVYLECIYQMLTDTDTFPGDSHICSLRLTLLCV